jgi:hypothetical protein
MISIYHLKRLLNTETRKESRMDNVKFYAKTAAANVARWLVLFGLGLFLVALGLYLGGHFFGNNADAANTGGGFAAILGIFTLFKTEFFTALLLVASFAFLAIYAIVASKVCLSFIISKVYENKFADAIGEKVFNFIGSINDKNPGWLQKVKNAGSVKEALLGAAREDSSMNKVQHKVLGYALNKVKLDDIDFKHPNLNLPQELSNRIMFALSQAAQPSYKLFGIAAGAHVLLMILAYFFDHS